MPVFSAKPLQFNKKWLEHSKQFLIVLFKVTNSLVYGLSLIHISEPTRRS